MGIAAGVARACDGARWTGQGVPTSWHIKKYIGNQQTFKKLESILNNWNVATGSRHTSKEKKGRIMTLLTLHHRMLLSITDHTVLYIS